MGPPPDRTVEINGQPAPDPSFFAVEEARDVRAIRIADHWLGLAVRIDLTPAARLWRFPVQTISQSESGYERVPQQICLLPAWPLGGPAEGTKLRLTLEVETREAPPA
jgi:alpha-amylase